VNITFRLKRRDLFLANVQAILQQRFIVVLVAIGSLWIGYQTWQDLSPTRSLLARVLTIIIVELIPLSLLGAILVLFLVYFAFSKNSKFMLTEQTITVDENFLASQNEYFRSEMKWKIFQRMVRTPQYLFLYFPTISAMVIPRHAFSTKEQWDSFDAFCRAKLQTA